ncbi:MAG TPA: type II toxin-antitoxin system VapC family toxin [Stellaceae bacterium]|nr:type II toxin-antitoxin system VapC family toxin [Stellaceae bacterium]
MPACVLDSAVALAWFLPGEGNAAIGAVLDQVAEAGALVPGPWPLEIANVLLMAERRQRITQAQRARALTGLGALSITIDHETAARAWTGIIDLAQAQSLTVYDAGYLELALRSGLPLATLDQALARAGRATGVAVLGVA